MNNEEKSHNFVFEKVMEYQASLLIEFEKTISEPKLYSTPLNLEGAIREIHHNEFFFIKNNEEIVGTVAYCFRKENRTYYISNMAIAPSWRRKGIARIAMKFLMKKMGDAHRIDLVTHPENFRSIPLYESFGFRIESRIENYFGDGEPRLVMVKN